jgi:CrcB protein
MIGLNWLLVGLGGFTGAICRFALQTWITRRFASLFPYGTLAVNVIGSFLLGLMMGLEAPAYWQQLQLLGGIGLLGAFTTYSTFAADSLNLLDIGQFKKFFMYQIASFGLAIGGAAAGYGCGAALYF